MRKLNDPTALSIADVQADPKRYASEMRKLESFVAEFSQTWRDAVSYHTEQIRRLVADYDGSDRSLCKLYGILAKHYPATSPAEWHDLPVAELLGYIDAIVEFESEQDTGVSIKDIGLALEYSDEDLTGFVKRFVDSKSITCKPIGKCPKDRRAKLYKLSEILADYKRFALLTNAETSKICGHLRGVARTPTA